MLRLSTHDENSPCAPVDGAATPQTEDDGGCGFRIAILGPTRSGKTAYLKTLFQTLSTPDDAEDTAMPQQGSGEARTAWPPGEP